MNAVLGMTAAPLSRMRRAVARTVTLSAAIPQFSVEVDICFQAVKDDLLAVRTHVPQASVTDLIHAAVIRSLARHPLLNSTWSAEGITTHGSVDLAFMVEAADGLMTPVLNGAEAMSTKELVENRQRLTGQALEGALAPHEGTGGTFTVSNLGASGIHRFTAMVMPGQAAVLAVAAPDPRGQLTLTLTCDHRAVDGAPAARFLRTLSEMLTSSETATTASPPAASDRSTKGEFQ